MGCFSPRSELGLALSLTALACGRSDPFDDRGIIESRPPPRSTVAAPESAESAPAAPRPEVADARAPTPNAEAGVDAPLDAGEAFAPDATPPIDARPPSCVEQPPFRDGACAPLGRICFSPSASCGGSAIDAYRCEDGGWLDVARCLDEPGCPADMPTDGAPCPSDAIGMDCFYETDTCASEALSQCTPSGWRGVNACPDRSLEAEPCTLVESSLGEQVLVQGPTAEAWWSSAAFTGTQMMLVYATLDPLVLRGHSLSTTSGALATTDPLDAPVVGPEPVTDTKIGAYRDRFTFAWRIDDGFVGIPSDTPGVFARQIDIDGTLGPLEQLDERRRFPTSVAVGPEGSLVAYFYDNRLGVAWLDASGALQATTEPHDEVYKAYLAVARAADRYVLAVKRPGDSVFTASPGTDLWLFDGPPTFPLGEPTLGFDATIQESFQLAGLASGGAVVSASPGIDHTGLVRVDASGTATSLDWPASTGTGQKSVAPFDDGILARWTTGSLIDGDLAYEFGLFDDGAVQRSSTLTIPNDPDRSGPSAVVCTTDRSIHVIREAYAADGSRSIVHRRFVCDR